ncbi:MAG: class I SAM-dependent methyltransferase [Nitrospira sp.]|nr:class I SAM-dependent methyltransferase [Nitrospira sp.]
MSQTMSQRERYDLEWNGWKAAAGAFEGVRRYGQISRRVAALAPGRLLDVGCGDGRLAREIKQVLPRVVVHGCDLSLAALDRAQGLDRQYAVDLNGERLPEPDGSLDLVIASEVIEHLIEPGRAMAEFHRVLRPGGHVLITVPNVAFWRFRVEALRGDVPSVTADERHLHSFNAALLSALAVREGFEVVTMTGLRQRYESLAAMGFTWLCDTLLLIGRRA